MPQQVTVILSAVTGNFEPRTLLLTPHDDIVSIGRASKSVVKGIVGAVDNAWFDSPVMSRDHAELRLDPETENVTIHDNGSMHGTTLNDKKIEQMTEVALTNGDIIVFGAEVRRGPEVFPACSFKVDLAFAPYHSGNTFSAPDSDIEEDEDEIYGSSDNDKDERDGASSGDGVSIDSPISVEEPVQIACPQPVKVAYAIQAIDLTRDDSPIVMAASSPMIDLTRDSPIDNNPFDHHFDLRPSPDTRSMEAALVPLVPTTNTDTQRGFALYPEDHPVLVDSEGEYGEYSSDDQSERALSDDSDSSGDSASEDSDSSSDASESVDEAQELHIHEISDSELDEVDEVDDEMEDSFDESQDVDSSTPHFPAYPHSVSYSVGGRVPAMRQNHAAGSEDIMDSEENEENDESDLGLSEAGSEDNIDYTADEMYYTKEDFEDVVPAATPATTMQFNLEFVKQPIVNPTEDIEQSYPSYPWSQAPPVQVVEQKLSSQANADIIPRQVATSSLSLGRQPSPSDAAMVKSALPKPVESTAFGVWQKAPEFGRLSQTLGEKTGKHAFFEAREKNKAELSCMTEEKKNALAKLTCMMETQKELDRDLLVYKRSSGSIVKKTGDSVEKEIERLKEMLPLAPPLPNAEYLGDKPQEVPSGIEGLESFQSFQQYQYPVGMDLPHHPSPLLYRAMSPDYDMTSAVSFNESKSKSVRSRLSIHDIIEKSSGDQSPPQMETKVGNKRKASEISDSIQDEVRAWASSPDRSPVHAPLVPDSTTPETFTAQVDRPRKKLKMVMDRVAYAAVGGFAVGATLFFGLVATAPDFV